MTVASPGADKIATRRSRVPPAPRDHVDGYVPGGRSENIVLPSRGWLATALRQFFRLLLGHDFAS